MVMTAHGDFSMDRFESAYPAVEDIRTYQVGRSRPIFNLEAPPIRSRLKEAIETEIGPRLVLLHHEASALLPDDNRPTREDIERLANLAVGSDETAATTHFETVRARHHSFATLLAYFVAPAA